MTSPKLLLDAARILANKELGQNFLVNPATAEMIVDKAALNSDETAVEIGAGLGALTMPLCRRAKKVFAVEKDTRLTPVLKGELAVRGVDNVEVVNRDILRTDLKRLAADQGQKLVILGNLPYNISSQVLVYLVEQRDWIDRAILMFQKELAQRIGASPGGKDYGRLSVLIQYCAAVETVAKIAPTQFFPRPKVDSTVIRIRFFDTLPYPVRDEKLLFRVVGAAFGKRRKTLKNALCKSPLPVEASVVSEILRTARIDPNRRAETLSVEEFSRLADTFQSFLSGENS